MAKITLLVLALAVTIAVVWSQVEFDRWVELKKPYDPEFVKALNEALLGSQYNRHKIYQILYAAEKMLIGANWYKAEVILDVGWWCDIKFVQELVSGGTLSDPVDVKANCTILM